MNEFSYNDAFAVFKTCSSTLQLTYFLLEKIYSYDLSMCEPSQEDVIFCLLIHMKLFFNMQPDPSKPNLSVGVSTLTNYGQFPHAYWYWIGIGALTGFYILFNVMFTLGLAYMPGKS